MLGQLRSVGVPNTMKMRRSWPVSVMSRSSGLAVADRLSERATRGVGQHQHEDAWQRKRVDQPEHVRVV
jgi:hypothetical protein